MSYRLGVDLGTTYTAAAILQGDEPQIVPLGDHDAFVPSVVVLQRDVGLLVGEPAERRSVTSPRSTAREFKRRLGDPTPVILDGVPYSAHALMAKVLRWVLDRVSAQEGGAPISVAVTYPANWGEYRRDVLAQAIQQIGVDDIVFVTEPEAAAVRYASVERTRTGDVIGVYDFGGGTFDAAILRLGTESFELLGRPAGVEQLGGVDIDEAVFAHVQRAVGEEAFDVGEDDPAVTAALHQLRRDCVLAKEALSYDTETTIPVNLPGARTMVRLTRAELEDMIRPLIAETVAAFRRALTSSGCSAADLSAVLLAGGSSRIPLVAELLSADLGRPVAVDAHPKHIVALGAAIRAAPQAEQGALAVRGDAAPATRTGSELASPAADETPEAMGTPLPTVTVHAMSLPVTRSQARLETPRGSGRRTDVVIPAAAAAALGLLALVLAFIGSGGGDDRGAVAVGNVNAAADSALRLADPLTLTVDGRALTGGLVTPSLAGFDLGASEIASSGTFSLRGLRHVLAGPFEAVVQPSGAEAVSRTAVIRPSGGLGAGGLLSIPGVAGMAALLFALAYAESFLRMLRRRRRGGTRMLLGMGMVGTVAGAGASLVGWCLGDHVLTLPQVLLCALLGLAACLALTVALSRRAGTPSGPLS